ncbi:MAG: MOSC domain containing protein [Candidatus Levybacteria bacterium GW2011_GWB1_39_7]|nr:MAG: MOSC domain containing protein [Candidatus Levybacteria bacterium GW2011_GWB1_39_7]
MSNGTVAALFICPAAGEPMQPVTKVQALTGAGLQGDRYAIGKGSFNKGRQGQRQVTLINSHFFVGTDFGYIESRRNVVTAGVELMWLIGREFRVGDALLRGVKYCDPCTRPNKLSGNSENFRDLFHDAGGLIAEVLEGGLIRKNDPVIPPDKGY